MMDRLVGYIVEDEFPRPSVRIQQADMFRQPCDDDNYLERWMVGSDNYRDEWTYDETTPETGGG